VLRPSSAPCGVGAPAPQGTGAVQGWAVRPRSSQAAPRRLVRRSGEAGPLLLLARRDGPPDAPIAHARKGSILSAHGPARTGAGAAGGPTTCGHTASPGTSRPAAGHPWTAPIPRCRVSRIIIDIACDVIGPSRALTSTGGGFNARRCRGPGATSYMDTYPAGGGDTRRGARCCCRQQGQGQAVAACC
jgi:hypothetical protein